MGYSNVDESRLAELRSLLDKNKITSKKKKGFQSFISDYAPIKEENRIESNTIESVQRPNSDLHRMNREKQKEYNRLMSLDINAAKQKYDDSEKKLEALQNELNFATSPEFTIKRRMMAGPLRSESDIAGDIEATKAQSKQYLQDYNDAKWIADSRMTDDELNQAIADAMKAKDNDAEMYYRSILNSRSQAKDDKSTSGKVLDLIGNSAYQGLTGWNKGITSTVDVLLGKPLQALGWEDNPISSVANYFDRQHKLQQLETEASKNALGGGTGVQVASQLTESTVAALPDAILALMTSGTSLGGKASTTAAYESANLLGKAGITAQTMARNPQYWMSFARELGSDYEEAVDSGASEYVAGLVSTVTALINAGVEIGSDGMSGIQGVPEAVKNGDKSAIRIWVEGMVEEGNEEVIQGLISRTIANATYNDAPLSSIGTGEGVIDPATMAQEWGMGAAVGGLLGGGQIALSNSKAKAFNTAADSKTAGNVFTDSEQAVFDKVYEKSVAEREADGIKLTDKEKSKLYDSIAQQMEKGGIDIDTIESTLGGDAYKAYKDTIDSEEKLKKELNELSNTETGKLTRNQLKRLEQLESMNLDDTAKRDSLRKQLDDTLSPLLENSRLAESYNEVERRKQSFEADLTQYKGKQRVAVERAIKSGVLNNTNRSHDLVNILSQIEADKGITFDYTNNAKLKESGFAIDGKTVNGYVTKNGVTLNVQSSKAWQSVVGHEITHVLEGTDAYTELRNALYKYAESKGELESRKSNLTELYKNVDADIDAELTAELVGDYLFSDKDFINHLTENRTIFRKIYDEIKYLCKVATGKELTDIEKVKREFDKAWKEVSGNGVDGKVKYHVSESFANEIDMSLDGKLGENSQVKARDYTPEILVKNGVSDLPMLITQKHLKSIVYSEADAKTMGLKTGGKNHYHGLGKKLLIDAVDSMDNPLEIYKQADDRYLIITEVKDRNGDNIIVPVKIDGKGTYNDVYIDENQILSVYGRKKLENYLAQNNFTRIYKKGTALNPEVQFPDISSSSQTAEGRRLTNTPFNQQSVSNPTIPQEPSGVNTSISENAENDTKNSQFYLDESNSVPLEQRVSGDDLLDAQDLIDTVKDVGAKVDENGYITVYHRTNSQSKEKILSSGRMTAKEDGVFFSTKKDGQNSGYGSEVIEFKIPAEKLMLDDIFDDEAHLRLPLKKAGETINVRPYLMNDTGNSQFSLSENGEQPSTVGTPLQDLYYDQDIAPVSENATTESNFDAPLPNDVSVTEEKANAVQDEKAKSDNEQNDQIAQILTETPEQGKKKGRIVSKVRSNFIDKGSAVEDLALKTKNRALQDKYKTIGRSEAKAQYFMENGADGVKSLDDIRQEVEQSGKVKEFFTYLYHKHNVDRMSLESKEAPNLARLTEKMQEYQLLDLKENQLRAIAMENVSKDNPKRAELVQTVRDYLASTEIKNKPVFGDPVTAEASQETANQLEKQYPQFKQYANDVYNYMNHLRDMMVENGIISKETAELWSEMYPSYVPIGRYGKNGLAVNVPLDTNRTGVNAPIKGAKGGNSDILPLFDTMAQRTIQTFKAIDKNNFGIELKNTLGSTFEASKAKLDDVIDTIDTQDGLLQEGKNGKNPTFTIFEDGKRVTFDITDDLYDAMKPTSEGLSYTNKVLNKASSLHKKVLTEYNLFFTARNAIKDAQDVLINSQHPAKTYANFPQAVKELVTGKGEYVNEYWENGGKQNTYFDKSTNTFAEEKSKFKKIVGFPLEGISKANDIVEAVPRLSEYIASRKKGATVEAAMLDAARVTTDFSAGGDVTKFLNRNGATFLNASVQGAAQQVRNIREAKANGLKGILKLAGKYALAGLPALLLNSLIWGDDDEYEELSDYVKDNYYIVGKYGDGQFVRIPKGRTLSVIQELFEQIGKTAAGEETDWGNVFTLAASNLAPNNPIDNNVIAPIVQAATNKTWYGEDLVPKRLQDVPASEQYDETIDSISKWLGENTGISPYKINYVLNQYTGFIGDMFIPALTPEAERENDSFAGNLIAPLTDQFTVDKTIKNQSTSDFFSKADELKVNANSQAATDEDILKSKYMSAVNSEMSDLYKQKREIQNLPLRDSAKYAQVRSIQEKINELAKSALNSYNNVSIDNGYATVGDKHYRLENGVWTKISDKQLERQQEVTSELGISPSEYWSKTEISYFPNIDGEYEYAYDNPEKYAVAKSVGGYEAYKSYKKDLYGIKSDKDTNGKSISGSRKEKVIDYINNLDADYETKLILFKSEYPSDNTYNAEIVEYLNNREDVSYDEMVDILTELGFTVTDDGIVKWD